MQWLVMNTGAQFNAKDNNGETPVCKACYNGHLEVSKWLVLKKGADIHTKNKSGETPLHDASYMGHLRDSQVDCRKRC